MSYETIKAKAELIRNETKVGGNTKERVAGIFDDVNETKADKTTVQNYVDDLYEKNDELSERIDKVSSSGLKGEAVPTTEPTEYNPIQYPNGLFEKYEVYTVGTYTNFKKEDGTPIVVTENDLNQKLAYINVTNGVSKLITVPTTGMTAKKVFDKTDDTNPATMKATADRYDTAIGFEKFKDYSIYDYADMTYDLSNVNPLIDGYYNANGTLVSSTTYKHYKINIEKGTLIFRKGVAFIAGVPTFLALSKATGQVIYTALDSGDNYKFLEEDCTLIAQIDTTVSQAGNYVSVIGGNKTKKLDINVKSSTGYTDYKTSSIKATQGAMQPFTNFSTLYRRYINAVSSVAGSAPSFNDNVNINTVIFKVSTGQMFSIKAVLALANGIVCMGSDFKFVKTLAVGPNAGAEIVFDYTVESGVSYIGVSYVVSKQPEIKKAVTTWSLEEKTDPNSDAIIGIIKSKIRPKLLENNTAEQNGLILTDAISRAWGTSTPIELPAGQFPLKNVTFLPVNMIGQDRHTIFYSTDASPMFVGHPSMGTDIRDNELIPNPRKKYVGCEVGHFCMTGVDIGTVAMDMGVMAFSKFERLVMNRFTECGLKLKGTLICDFSDIHIRACKNGIISEAGVYPPTNEYYAPNLVSFRKLILSGCTNIGINWKNGSGIALYELDAEGNGSSGDANTGVLWIHDVDTATNLWHTGFALYDCWGERNSGGFYMKIDSRVKCSIRDANIQSTPLGNMTPAKTAVINNAGHLLLDNVLIQNFTDGAIQTNNAGSVTLVQGLSNIGNHTESNGGQYKQAVYS